MTDLNRSWSPTKSRWDQPPRPSSSSSPFQTPKQSRWDLPPRPPSSSSKPDEVPSVRSSKPQRESDDQIGRKEKRDSFDSKGWKDQVDRELEMERKAARGDGHDSTGSESARKYDDSRDRERYDDGQKGKSRFERDLSHDRGRNLSKPGRDWDDDSPPSRTNGNRDRDHGGKNFSSYGDRERQRSRERERYPTSSSSHHRNGSHNDKSWNAKDRPYEKDRYYDDTRDRKFHSNGYNSYNKSRTNSHDEDRRGNERVPAPRDSPRRDIKSDSVKSGIKIEEQMEIEKLRNQDHSDSKVNGADLDVKQEIKSVKKEESNDLESDSGKAKLSSPSKTSNHFKREKRRSSTSSESDSERSDSSSTSSSSSSTSSSRRKSKSRSQSPTTSTSKPVPKSSTKASTKSGKNIRAPMKPVQIIDHLPRAEESALKSFIEMENCTYARGLGRSRGKTDGDGMVCECTWRFGPDPPTSSDACGSDSDCINRLTQVECLESECRCSVSCQNQRFQKREYADVEVVQTEKKGYGIRAGSEIYADQFIYEYIGEVVPHEVFMKRMQKYKDEGIQHFYFMMLQKDEYLDATKKGGKGRFLNHSCNPNCYVAKWHVGKHMRMGIFAKRDIIAGEELTFNYNVDRYGNDAQECFCGEPNCVGSIGGKTQTDIGGMDDLFINALGIEDEVELLEAKGTKKKKSKHLDDDFNPTLRPMVEEEVPKVMTAVRQATDNRGILSKLLSRIHMTEDAQVQKLLVRLHGFSLMSAVLDDWKDDKEIVTLTLGTLARWPLIARNKVVSAGVDQQVKDFCDDKDEEIKNLAKQLVEAWDALEVGYRIARKEAAEKNQDAEGEVNDDIFQDRRRYDDVEMTLDTAQAPNAISAPLGRIVPRPLGTQVAAKPTPSRPAHLPKAPRFSASHHRSLDSPITPGTPRSPSNHPPSSSLIPGVSSTSPGASTAAPSRSISDIIRMANENEERQRKLKEEQAEKERERILAEEKKSKRSSKSSETHGKHSSDKEKEKRRREKEKERERERERKKRKLSSSSDPNAPMDQETLERRLEKLVGEIAVGAMSKQKDKFEKDEFKKYAKDLTSTICAKEKKNPKSWPPPSGRLDSFSDEKRIKMKAFSKEWITKLIQRKEEDENSSMNNMNSDPSFSNNIHHPASTNPALASSSSGSGTTPTDGSSNTTNSASISTPRDSNGMQPQLHSTVEPNGKNPNSSVER